MREEQSKDFLSGFCSKLEEKANYDEEGKKNATTKSKYIHPYDPRLRKKVKRTTDRRPSKGKLGSRTYCNMTDISSYG